MSYKSNLDNGLDAEVKGAKTTEKTKNSNERLSGLLAHFCAALPGLGGAAKARRVFGGEVGDDEGWTTRLHCDGDRFSDWVGAFTVEVSCQFVQSRKACSEVSRVSGVVILFQKKPQEGTARNIL